MLFKNREKSSEYSNNPRHYSSDDSITNREEAGGTSGYGDLTGLLP